METAKDILDIYTMMKLWPSHWWFSDVMSSKHAYANYDQFIPNFNMACKKLVSLANSKTFGRIKPELWTKDVWKFSIMLFENMGLWAKDSYQNINVWRFSKLWTALSLAFSCISAWNLQKNLKMGLFTLAIFTLQN